MNTSRFLPGATILFWGWQTGFVPVAAGMAVVLEGARWLPRKWALSPADFARLWQICLLLFVGAGVYSYTAEDLTYTALAFIQCLPMIFFPFVGALSCSTVERVSVGTFLSFAGRPTVPGVKASEIDVRYPFFAVCLLAASAANVQDWTFYAGASVLIAWALWSVRSRRSASWVTGLLLAAAIAAGYAGHRWLREFQSVWEIKTVNWMASLRLRALEERAFNTTLGELGALKLSGRIVLHMEADDPKHVPRLLREASYNQFNNGGWRGLRAGFAGVTKDERDVWQVQPGLRATQSVTIACSLLNGSGVLPLPSGAARISGLPAAELDRNRLGSVRAGQGPNAVRFRVHYDPATSLDGPPDELDTRVPELEAGTLAKLADKLRLKGMTPDEAVRAVTAFFHDRFEYSTYVKPRLGEAFEEGTPLTRFLMSRRAGHCEYFAASAVLLLRQAGVPARYATGYAVTEAARHGRAFVVRERHGHAWALVFLNGAWRDLDTTPPSWSAVEEKRSTLFEPLADAWTALAFKFSELRWLLKSGALMPYLVASLVVLTGFLVWRIVARRQRSGASQGREPGRRAWPGVDSEFYQIEKRLAELGAVRQAGETFASWLRRVGAARPELIPRELLQSLLTLHNRYRFDPGGLDSEQRALLTAQVKKCLAGLS